MHLLIKIFAVLLIGGFSMAAPNSAPTTCHLVFKNVEAQAEYNRQVVLSFNQEAFGDLNFQSAAERFIDPTVEFIQHSPFNPDGIPGFVATGNKLFKGTPIHKVDIRASIADANTVWLHSKMSIQGTQYAKMDIYKLSCGKIVEHWDVVQEIGHGPFANSHPFF